MSVLKAEVLLAGIATWIATNYIVFGVSAADHSFTAFVRWIAGAF
jgi:hypothetical protein